MNGRHVRLIAAYSARYSVRGGIGLVFLLLSLSFGLLVANSLMQPVEIAIAQLAKHAPDQDPVERTRRAVELTVDNARPAVEWVLTPSSAATDRDSKRAIGAWADFLLDDRPALLSAIFLVLLFGWPLVVACGAFDLYSGDIGSRQLRYQLLRADRGSIYLGRLLGMLATLTGVLGMLGLTVVAYTGLQLPMYTWPALVAWGAYGTAALVVVSLPYLAVCAWISASFSSAFASLTVTTLVVGCVQLVPALASRSYEDARYLSWLLPWGFQTRLFHPDALQVALAVGGCALQTAVFGWLGHRKFTRRDL